MEVQRSLDMEKPDQKQKISAKISLHRLRRLILVDIF